MEQAIFIELEMNSLRDIQPRITSILQEMHECYEIEDWPAFKDLALSCQILTIRQIESYNRLLKKSTSIDMTNQLQLNLESSNENLVKFKTITRQVMKLKKTIVVVFICFILRSSGTLQKKNETIPSRD